MDFDLREYAYQVLDLAKENLQSDGYLAAAAFLITPEQVHVAEVPAFDTAEEKHFVYQAIIAEARKRGALAILTLNDAYIGPADDDPDSYYEGKLAAEGAQECIVMTLSGPAIPSWGLTLPYTRVPGGIQFGEPEEGRSSSAGLLEGWASEASNPS